VIPREKIKVPNVAKTKTITINKIKNFII